MSYYFNWYRRYSDNFKEQCGYASYPQLAAGGTGGSTINLPKSYSNTSFKVFTSICADGGNSWTIKVYTIHNNSKTQFQVGWATKDKIDNTTGRFYWYTYGF